jgi:type II secretory ATPase GspE/PulE/Tfp pilus assembly ATPase PilB-like protein
MDLSGATNSVVAEGEVATDLPVTSSNEATAKVPRGTLVPGSRRESLVQLLMASGVEEMETARELAALRPPAGSTWTIEVLNSGKVDESRFTHELGNRFRTRVDLLEGVKIEREVLGMLPGRFVFKHHLLPIRVDDEVLTVATYDVFNFMARRLAAQQLPGRRIAWVLTPRTFLLRSLRTAYGVGADTFEEILKNNRAFEAIESEQALDITNDDPEASVVRFVNQIIREAITERATDIHVEPLDNDLRIRYRIDGMLHEVAVPPQLRVLQSAIISRLKVMSHMDIAERRVPQDGRINLATHAGAIDVRVSTIPTVNGESISLRLLSRTETLTFGLSRLDMAPKEVAIVKELLAQPNGIILVTGPTGSGKSTTLYSFLSSINAVHRRIITIEEPVEYRLQGVSQIDVKSEIGLTFANGLRAILRQDPNIVMVGEIRDFETAEIAIRAAMTGHLVFSTLHTNDAVSGITRLLDMGIEPFLLASVVRAFLAQRLVRTVCEECKQPASYDHDYLREIGAEAIIGHTLYRGTGCDTCRKTGYRGRSAIYEICVVNENLRRMVVRKETGSAMKGRAIADGWRRVLRGQTTVEEVVRVTQVDELLAETDE